MSVHHKNVVRVYDTFEEDHLPCLVMELAKGPLQTSYGNWPLTNQQVKAVMLDVLSGLEALHQAHIVHRDIKPGNLLVSEQGQVLLSDLGIARQDRFDATVATLPGQVLGTRLYMAPEQLRGSKNITKQVDIYAAGATLYALCTGRRPPDLSLILLRLDLLDTVAEPFRQIIVKACSMRPKDRYASAYLMRADLKKVAFNSGKSSTNVQQRS